uniref:Presenilin n=1 Tax=Globisporangium ultimum (strain ATCC 200006 / CBS 805.95 / DAOM BR144) TaxID=431595 RepID=K3XBK3_GLOUD
MRKMAKSPPTSPHEGDVHERLLRPQDKHSDVRDDAHAHGVVAPEEVRTAKDEDDDPFTHEELQHSIGSFFAVVWPVTITMLLASFVSSNVADPSTAAALADAYLIYGPDSDAEASDGTKFEEAMINALAIVSFFLIATFVIVCCYKFNFNRMLIGYMMFSSMMLLGLLGGNIVTIALAQTGCIVDIATMFFALYNFAVVGVISIFYQKGAPKWIGQVYLVLTSVIMAWQLGQFPEWSTWALVIVLAFYDLCAVLTPCGPLKWLVNLVQQEGRPLPGLLYEAEVRREPSSAHSQQYMRVEAQSSSSPVTAQQYYQYDPEAPREANRPNNAAPPPPANLTPHEKVVRERLVKFYAQHNPAVIARVDKVMARYRGREAELWRDLHEKYIADDLEEENTIKLGLGDFVFYSVLVSRAAKFDFSAMVGCLVTVLMGLGGTLFLLGVYKKALPALPISILLAVTIYFWIHGVFVEYANSAFDLGVLL